MKKRDSHGVCDRRDLTRKEMLPKGRKFLRCPVCDKAGTDRLPRVFLADVAQARQDLGLPEPS